ncbi:two-component system sensor histidine kinase NtrB [Hyalangium gracile]|uniref:two-component system sensor histidine kinase NtrB n=1 Tax=Hyalangium gracile TaxID=394092 RepID=UPI001CCD84F9|nr:ATP-binding protein [Hyalangium gracile]
MIRLNEFVLAPLLPRKESPIAATTPAPHAPSWETLILRAIPSCLLAADAEERVVYANAAAMKLLGRDERSLIGTPLRELLPFPWGVPGQSALELGSSEMRFDVKLTPQGGTEPQSIGVSLLSLPAHLYPPGGYVCMFRSLTDYRRVEAEARQAERLMMMGQLMAGLAHEVRNPLAALKSLLEDVLHGSSPEAPFHEHMVRMERLVRRMENLVNTSLQFSRRGQARRARHAPAALVHAARDALDPRLLRARSHPLVLEVRDDLPAVLCEEGPIVQVLGILLTNALEAAGSSGWVGLRVSTTGEPPARVLFEVEDDGPGIPASLRTQLFSPFFTTKPQGTGLGLSIALKLVEQNQGHLRFQSVPGQRTVFTVDLPVATEGPP